MLFLAPVISRGIGFVITLLVARLYSPYEAGAYRFAFVFVWYFMLFSDIGLTPVLIRELATSGGRFAETYAAGVFLRLAAVSVSSILIVVAVASLHFGAQINFLIGLFSLALLPSMLNDTNAQTFVAIGLPQYSLLTEFAGAVIYLGLGAMCFLFKGELWALALAKVTAVSVQCGISAALLARLKLAQPFRLQWAPAKILLAAGLPIMVNGMAAQLISKADVFLLERMAGLQVVGWYTLAYLGMDIFALATNSLANAAYPVLSRMYQQHDVEGYSRLTVKATALTLLLSVAAILLVFLLASPLVSSFLGPAYIAAVPALYVLAWAFPFYGVCNILGLSLLAAREQMPVVKINLLSLLVNVIANFLLIPRWAHVGAAFATVAAYFVCSALYLIVAIRAGMRFEMMFNFYRAGGRHGD